MRIDYYYAKMSLKRRNDYLMPSCLKCGRVVETGLELFCPRCLGKAEKKESNNKAGPRRNVMIYICAGIMAALLLGTVMWRYTAPAASRLTVPDNFPSIQAGIDAAGPGDTIVLKPGVYHENIDFKGKGITLRSTSPDDQDVVAATVIQGNGGTPTVLFQSGETGETLLQGLTIVGGTRINSNDHGETDNAATKIGNMGIGGGVIFIDAGCAPVIRDNIITSGTAQRGGGIYINNASPSIISNTIINNRAHWEGGALYMSAGSKPLIRENIITNNIADAGGGIYVLQASPVLQENRIAGNSTLYQGGGIMVQSGAPELHGNDFAQNSAGECGGAAAFFDASPILHRNHFAGNEGGWRGGGAIYIGLKSTPQLKENTFTQNKAPQGRDIWISADSSLQEDHKDSLQNIDIYKQD